MSDRSRELTRDERAAIRRLVTTMCANYDSAHGCLPLDDSCYMLGKCWTGAYCRYFREAVLPLDPMLEATLAGRVEPESKRCAVCGQPFPVSGKRACCSSACAGIMRNKRQRAYMRKKRG